MIRNYTLFTALMLFCEVLFAQKTNGNFSFPKELVSFVAYEQNPIFKGTKQKTWDERIRERGYILKEKNNYFLWYTGYSTREDKNRYLGCAISKDGINWERYENNPIYKLGWVEDISVIKSDGIYYMFSEGKDDIAHLLTSKNRIDWEEKGNLDIRQIDGQPIKKGAYGTPTIYKEKGIWYLFYERDDSGIWLATSKDVKVWINVQDEPVIAIGPTDYDKYAVAMNQVIKYKGLYYGYYHASAYKDWHEWSTNVAVSKDLIHWQKYENNPILGNNKSSGMVLKDGKSFRFYTMHPEVNVYFSK